MDKYNLSDSGQPLGSISFAAEWEEITYTDRQR